MDNINVDGILREVQTALHSLVNRISIPPAIRANSGTTSIDYCNQTLFWELKMYYNS